MDSETEQKQSERKESEVKWVENKKNEWREQWKPYQLQTTPCCLSISHSFKENKVWVAKKKYVRKRDHWTHFSCSDIYIFLLQLDSSLNVYELCDK